MSVRRSGDGLGTGSDPDPVLETETGGSTPAVKADEERCAQLVHDGAETTFCGASRSSSVHSARRYADGDAFAHPFVSEQTAPVVETERKHEYVACLDCDENGEYHRKGVEHCATCGWPRFDCDGAQEPTRADLPAPSAAPVEREMEPSVRFVRFKDPVTGEHLYRESSDSEPPPETARQRAHRLLDELIDHHCGTRESSFACFRVVCSDAEPLSNAIQAVAREEVRNGKAE